MPIFPRTIFTLLIFLETGITANSQHKDKKSAGIQEPVAFVINLREQLEIFQNNTPDYQYSISLCGDVPNDRKPWQVAHNKETGHVFIILQKIKSGDTASEVFGFYPKRGLPTLLFKTISSRIKDNSLRRYDVEVIKFLSPAQFDTAIQHAVFFATHRYHINRYNCYDFALHVFNSVEGNDTIPNSRVRFPTIFGKGGSPCGLYRDLEKIKKQQSPLAGNIHFGKLVAPPSTQPRRIKKTGKYSDSL
jgi:hypothetical protein